MFSLALIVLLLQPFAPGPDRYALVHIREQDTVAVERVVASGSSLVSEILIPNRIRMTVDVSHDGQGCVSNAEVRVFPWGSGPDAGPLQRVTVGIDGDSIRVLASARGVEQQFSRYFPGVQTIIAGESVAAGALVVECALASGETVNTVHAAIFPNLRPQDVSVQRNGEQGLILTTDTTRITFASDDLITELSIGANNLLVRRITEQELSTIRFAGTDYSPPPGATYAAHDVRIRVDESVQLAATLTVPSGRLGPFPVVVTISGSGPQNRDSYSGVAGGWRPFRQLADTLGRTGVAVLRYDDRGAGRSTGDYASSTERTSVKDVQAILRFLRNRNDIDSGKIVLLGHSEGARIAMMVAAQDQNIAGIALLSGAAYPREAVRAQALWIAEHQSGAESLPRDSVIAHVNQQMDKLATTMDREVFRWDAASLSDGITSAVGIFHGATDRQVPVAQADSLEAIFTRSGNEQVQKTLFPETNHLLVPDPDGDFLRYDDLPDAHLETGVLGVITEWIVGLNSVVLHSFDHSVNRSN